MNGWIIIPTLKFIYTSPMLREKFNRDNWISRVAEFLAIHVCPHRRYTTYICSEENQIIDLSPIKACIIQCCFPFVSAYHCIYLFYPVRSSLLAVRVHSSTTELSRPRYNLSTWWKYLQIYDSAKWADLFFFSSFQPLPVAVGIIKADWADRESSSEEKHDGGHSKFRTG